MWSWVTKQRQNRLEVTWYVKQGSEISASVCLSACLSVHPTNIEKSWKQMVWTA